MNESRDHSRQLFFATIVALVLGAAAGVFFGAQTEPLGEISKLVIQALKAVAVPLLFAAIVEALAKSNMSGRGFSWLLIVTAINGTMAIGISLVIVNVFKAGEYLTVLRDSLGQITPPTLPTMDWRKVLDSFIPDSLVAPFLSGSTPAVILIALALGLALRHLLQDGSKDDKAGAAQILRLVSTSFQLLVTIISKVVYLVPIAVFCAVAKAVGKSGLAVASGLSIFVVVCVGGMLIHILITYQGWILLHPRLTLKAFWRAARAPGTYAFGINSSLATMPMTLQALDEIGVKEEAARLSACVGTNFNNDGILLYQVVAALLLAQAFGQDLSIFQQIYVAFISIIATLGVAGFPEAGAIALTLVLSALNLPTEAIVMLMSVDWLIARSRSATNVLGDMAVAVAIDKFLPLKLSSESKD